MHLADLHLGCEQYGLKQRSADIARAFYQAAQAAVEERVDFVLIAGDVFHNRSIDPATLLQAVQVLGLLRDAGIPVIAVAGNHDRGWRTEGHSWLSVLHDLGYLIHLEVVLDQGTLRLNPPSSARPSYFEVGDVRVIGVPYLGAALPKLVGQLADCVGALEPKYTVLLTHSGISGEIPGFPQALRQEDLRPLRDSIHYVALGHLHKPFEREGWLHNPGSLEALGVDEVQFEGGWFLVQPERSADGAWRHTTRHVKGKRRLFRRLQLEVDACETPDAVMAAAIELAAGNRALAGRQALIELTLRGGLRFSPAALDLNRLEGVLTEQLQPLKVLVRNLAEPAQFHVPEDDDATRHEIEARVLQQVIAGDSRYSAHQESLARLALEVKDMTLGGADDEAVFARVLAGSRELGLAPAAPEP